MKILKHLRRLERANYPYHMQQMQDVYCMDDLAEYCECKVSQVNIVSNNDAYFITSHNEIVDICGDVSISFVRKCISSLGKGWYECDCRSVTWRFVKTLERLGKVAIKNVDHWDWDGDDMVYCEIKRVV